MRTRHEVGRHVSRRLEQIPFTALHEPGVYIDNETGSLFRVPQDALMAGANPVIEIVSKSGSVMTKVTDDPWCPIGKVRQIAADADLVIDF